MSAPTISNSFTTSTRYIYHTEETCTRVGNRVQFRGKMRNIRNDEYGEFLSFDGSKHYAKDTRPYKLSLISRCPWSNLADTLPRCFDTLRLRKRCLGANRKYDERACIIHAFERCHKVVLKGNTKVEEYVVELRKPLRHVEQVEQVEQVEHVEHVEHVEEPQHILVNVNTLQQMLKRLDELEQRVRELEEKKPVAITSTPAPPLTSPTKPDRPTPKTSKDQPEKKKVHVPKHEPETHATRFVVGTYHPAYGSPTLKIHKIKNTKCGKYVYLEHDYDGEEPNETYRRKVYFKDGYEYYTEDLECEQIEITAKEFEHVKDEPEAKEEKRASPTFKPMHEPEREGVERFEVGTHNDCMTITAITHSPDGVKYVYFRIHDGDEVYRNTVYYEQGGEYFQHRGTGEDYWNKEHACDFG